MDWISDGIARMRNALMVKKSTVEVRGTKQFLHVLEAMKQEGFLDYKMNDPEIISSIKQACTVKFFYRDSQPVIRGFKRISKPSLRIYVSSKELRPYLKRFSMPIVSTSAAGVVSGRYAIGKNLGGELLCEVY